MKKICPVCLNTFETIYTFQKYCCVHCRKIYYKKIYYNKPRIISNIEDNEPILKQFYCKKCHILVTVTNIKDRRKNFVVHIVKNFIGNIPNHLLVRKYNKKGKLIKSFPFLLNLILVFFQL